MNDHYKQCLLGRVKNANATTSREGDMVRRRRWEGSREKEDWTYSGKVELGCNGGWLGSVGTVAGGSEGKRRRKIEGRRVGGGRLGTSWFSSEVTYLEANLIHSPKEENRGLVERPPSDWTIASLRVQYPGIHRKSPGRDRREEQFWSSLPFGYDLACKLQNGEIL